MAKVFEFTEDNFQETIEKAEVALVDFWAIWCGPCRMVAPTIKQLAKDYGNDTIVIGKLDVDSYPELAGKYRVRSIPTLLFFKDGQVYDKIIGAAPRARIEAKLKEIVPVAS